jgi:hypothetical protein
VYFGALAIIPVALNYMPCAWLRHRPDDSAQVTECAALSCSTAMSDLCNLRAVMRWQCFLCRLRFSH